MSKVLTATPRLVTQAIVRACGTIGAPGSPFFVAIEPSAGAEANRCVHNVRLAAEVGEGTPILGWKLSEWPRVLFEFIGHAILEKHGVPVCITPDRYGEARILFLPDASLQFDFANPMARMPTRRVPATADRDVADFIHVEEEIVALKSTVPPSSGLVALSGVDADRFRHLELRKRRAFRDIALRTIGELEPCVCEKGRLFGKCCRPGMRRERQAERAV